VRTRRQAHGPGSPVSLALALLDRTWPSIPALDDSPAGDVLARLETDPRCLVGRLQQAMTILLAADLPLMDPQTALLSPALDDALDWRLHTGRATSATNAATRSATSAPRTGNKPTATTNSPAPSA
jgi:hypothetical protein